MSHHEPIWKFYHQSNGKPDYSNPVYGVAASLSLLDKAYSDILCFIKWMSKDRYQSFIDAKLDIEFRKLCSHDGFYAYVNPEKITNKFNANIFSDQSLTIVCQSQSSATALIENENTIYVIGVNSPAV